MMSSFFGARRVLSRRRSEQALALAAEVLEQRTLLTFVDDFGAEYNSDPEYDSQVIGRANDGIWWTSEFDLAGDYGPDVTTTFAGWSTTIDWRFVGTGDFDGDALSDVAGWDPSSGAWWVSLSDGIASTTTLGVTWATNTTWADVRIADANNDGLDDLIGRASNGTWYAAIANGDGTFHNVGLVTWDANGGWRDVFVADIDQNGLNDLVGRSSTGVWQASFGFGFTNLTVTLGQWDESQGWHDTRFATLPFQSGMGTVMKPSIVARSATGQWQAIAFNPNRTANTVLMGNWNEAANWRDVFVVDLNNDNVPELVGRTSYGEWWASSWNGTSFNSQAIGYWTEAAGWNDVYVERIESTGAAYLIGRTDDGAWWASNLDSNGQLQHQWVGYWSPTVDWQDVADGTFTRSPISIRSFTKTIEYRGVAYPYPYFDVNVYAHRSGAIVNVFNRPSEASFTGVRITYRVPSTGVEMSREIAVTAFTPTFQSLKFFGRNGNDAFVNASVISTRAWGLGGDDTLSGLNNRAYDELFGGPGVDMLFGDPGDKLVQD